MKILLIGANGQVGSQLVPALAALGDTIAVSGPAATGGPRLDLQDAEAIAALIRKERPQVLVNAAAYTAVDKAEDEVDVAFAVNATAPGVMARECAQQGALLVHYSTDYVFDGSGSRPWRVTDTPQPLNVYGRSKLAGEAAITAVGGVHVILRTSWVFNETGTNFVRTMLRLGAERDELAVVSDQCGAPTSAAFLASQTARIVATAKDAAAARAVSGIYHLACDGETTWHGFAVEIFRQARALGMPLRVANVRPIPSTAYPTKARRPQNSRLACETFYQTFGGAPLPWRTALADVLARLAPRSAP